MLKLQCGKDFWILNNLILFIILICITVSCTNSISSSQGFEKTESRNEDIRLITELYKCIESNTGDTIFAKSVFTVHNNDVIVDSVVDLNGKVLILPEKSNLCFKGNGKIFNGIIAGNFSSIKSSSKRQIFEGCLIDGIWNVEKIYSSWMAFSDFAEVNTSVLRNLMALCSDSVKNVVYIDKGVYPVRLRKNDAALMNLKSNTKLVLDGVVSLTGTDFTHYQLIRIWNKENVVIEGTGCLEGDVKSHISNEGEWGMGLSINHSENINIRDIKISGCWGDCIYVGQTQRVRDNFSSDIKIYNVTCESGRRQGISIIAGKNITLERCKIFNTGSIKSTLPSAGIDIEPNINDAVLDNILIKDCMFKGNTKNHDIMFYRLNPQSKILIEDCTFPTGVALFNNVWGVTFKNCKIRKISDRGNYKDKQNWINCVIGPN